MRKLLIILFMVAGLSMLSGCLEDADVVLHQPGVYKGPEDALLSKGSQAAILSERFNTVQIDR